MERKDYQTRVCSEVQTFLVALRNQHRAGNTMHPALDAWNSVRLARRGGNHPLAPYVEATTGGGKDLPTICLKVPTGGGKTFLATQILGIAYETILAERNGTGLVLWVVPTDQIYQDTLKALRDRTHFYRESLEFAVTPRIQIWERQDIGRLSPADLVSGLNILLLKLQGTNRKDKETLKYFRDSPGNIVRHFPAEDDPAAHKALLHRIPNLDMIEADEETGRYLTRTSIANLVRQCEPIVILDEKQKAASNLARKTIEGFNPALVVELSATPPKSVNVLCTVTGAELMDQEMIKLPINVANSGQKSWQQCLTQARGRREELAAKARAFYMESGRYIRPIVLVQVERVGRDQRDGNHIHSEDAREYLIQNLGIDSEAVKVKTSESNEIENLPLLSDECRVEWIITKAALQEGWDCPFAYILVSLANLRSEMSMTQLVGRVLRQPQAKWTTYKELNESYVYTLHLDSRQTVKQIRKSLYDEGYEGDATSVVDSSAEGSSLGSLRTVMMRPEFPANYVGPIPGSIFLPRFCVRTQDQNTYEPLDYFGHLIRHVDVRTFNYSEAATWDLARELKLARECFFRVFLSDDALEQLHPSEERPIDYIESDDQTIAWLVANLGMNWFSAGQLRFMVSNVCGNVQGIAGQISLVRFALLEKMIGLIQSQTDLRTEQAFRDLHIDGRIGFYHERRDCVFEIPKRMQKQIHQPLLRPDSGVLQRSLFDVIDSGEFNGLEADVVYSFDDDADVFWWHRNAVGQFGVQGWRRSLIYPDFVVQMGRDGKAQPHFLIVESKGAQLEGSNDTKYKRQVGELFNDAGLRVKWQELSDGVSLHHFEFRVLDQGEYLGNAWQEAWRGMKNRFGYGIDAVTTSTIVVK